MSDAVELQILKKELELLQRESKDKDLNPHKYYDLYEWQDDFIYQANHIKNHGRYPHRMYLTVSNQSGKSTAAMLLGHMLCTDVEFRKNHWGVNQPRVIWYCLPTQDHINDFYNEKWEPEILSRDEAKKEGKYAWKEQKKGQDIIGIYFKETKCTLKFVSLSARSSSLQGRTVGAIIFDEEPDVLKLAELETRTASFNDPETGLSNAILAFAFTPTSAQAYFKRIFQFQDDEFLSKIPTDLKDKYFLDKESGEYRTCSPNEAKEESFKRSSSIWKRRISMFETLRFKSGKRGKFTVARIREYIRSQPSLRDKMIRAFAQFERQDDSGVIYKYFKRTEHLTRVHKVNIDKFKLSGFFTAGIDYGSGSNHPGGYVITWISKDKKDVRVVKMWRGEQGKITTAGDIIERYIEATRGMLISFPFYDHSCADLATIYNRMTGKALMKANKSVDHGVGVVDTLYKHKMLAILCAENEPYGEWLAVEYENLSTNKAKKDRSDELTDCVRYSLSGVSHMFDLEEIAMVEGIKEIKQEINKLKTPEDYGVRSWDNVPDDELEDEWRNDDIKEWEGVFNEF